MDWPIDSRPFQPGNHRRAAKITKHSFGNTLSQDYPRLGAGTYNAATLRRTGRRYNWSSIINDSPTRRLSITGAPILLRQACRGLDSRPSTRSDWRIAKQQVHFLSKHYPEVDIEQGFLQDYIMSDLVATKELDYYDPYAGNLIRPIYFSGPGSLMSGVLYASGETYNELNLCTFAEDIGLEDISLHWFSRTPIKQIESSLFDSQDSSHLCIRTMGGLSFLHMYGPPEFGLDDICELSRDDFGDRPVTDVRFFSRLEAIVANDCGGLFNARMEESDVYITTIRKPPNGDITSGLKPFHRVGATAQRQNCLVASNKVLELIDLRDNISALNLYTTDQHEVMASIGHGHRDGLVSFMTTSDIIWIDLRNPGKPLFSYKHELSQTHPLDLQTEIIGNTSVTFAFSTSNGFITIYDVSRQIPLEPFRVNSRPYALRAPLGFHQFHDGYAFVKHPNGNSETIDLVQLSKNGSLCSELIVFRPVDELDTFHHTVVENSQEPMCNESWVVPLRKRSHAIVDMSPIYDYLANKFEYDPSKSPHDMAVSLERMVHILQEEDGPIDNVMTTLEIVVRASDERDIASRADFLSTTHVTSHFGHEAWMTQQLPFENLRDFAVWEYDLTTTLQALKGDIADPPLIGFSARADAMMKELQFDLAMGRNVYSTRSMQLPTADPEMRHILVATETLSITKNGGLPPATFGFLRPTKRIQGDNIDKTDADTGEDEDIVPAGARILLRDWEVGQNPDSYNFTSLTAEPSTFPGTPSSPTNDQNRLPMGVPPAIAATQPMVLESIQRNMTQSQDFYPSGQDPGSGAPFIQSPEYNFPSTQPLPGPFGGRPTGKKKTKRVGGF